jgi:hypothetical protein
LVALLELLREIVHFVFNLVARLGDNPVEIIHVGNSDDFARHPECFFERCDYLDCLWQRRAAAVTRRTNKR